jgi:hypothetical protein
MRVIEWDGDFPKGGYTGTPKWMRKRPIVPYRKDNGTITFESYGYGRSGWAEVEQDFTSQMQVLRTETGRSAANMILLEPSTGYQFVSTQNDLDYLLANCVLTYGLMDKPVTWRFYKRGSNYLLNIVERLEKEK